ncbi:MAG: AAA family ATPase [Planctomycetota bacterium]|nr:MAG: AAA family ATPase [Planctomycetota bacterium]REJ94160.1 MAG: AAA family ATPase [Planctomycetota bacterium]REK26346.1 MAG: AAA family ATPase [Planctomycetota bacterium]REK45897.1 MAG: AAA family ATPase [Planctomycetota bacterium]
MQGSRVRCPKCQGELLVPTQPPPSVSATGSDAPAANASDGGPPFPASLTSPPGAVPPAATADASTDTRWSNAPAGESTSPPAAAPATGASGQATAAATQRPASPTAQRIQNLFERITAEIRKVYVGQDDLVRGSLVALFSAGHVLIESVPGLGKTLFVRTLGRVMGCKFGRIQFTPDLMPSDITGAPIFDMKTQEFEFRPGPVFTQFLLADEINRSPAKAHAALLEIMQEYRVTVDGVTHPIERPFLVLATQNPIESEGTYNLPEAQLDRFMFKLKIEYPTAAEEANVLRMHGQQSSEIGQLEDELDVITSPAEILELTDLCGQVHVEDPLIDYINALVRQTREWPYFHMGASPRAGLSLVQGARTLAAFYGRDYAVPDDVLEIAPAALRHRVIVTAEAEVEGRQVDELLGEMIRTVEVPRM